MRDWSALEEAAAALRRLNRAVAGVEIPDAELRRLALAADELARRVESGTPRDKEQDFSSIPGVAEFRAGRPAPLAEGAGLEFDPFSAAGGRLHPASVGLDLRRDGAASVIATTTVDAMFQGPPDRVHGGVVAMIVDEVMGAVNRLSGTPAYTARLSVNLRAAAPIGRLLTFRAWRHETSGRKLTIRAEGRSDEGVFVEADSLFLVIEPPPG